MRISGDRFQVLVDYSFAWICRARDLQNITQLFSSDTSDVSLNDTTASGDPDTDICTQDDIIVSSSQVLFDAARLCSTPKNKCNETEKENILFCIDVNTESIVSKKESLWHILESESPDIF